jgi:uncharacterized protein YndB with AHSA1/START domain
MATSDDSTPSSDRELVITRVVNAPRELVWKAFTESDRLARWWGPERFTMLAHTLDFRPGGAFHYSILHAFPLTVRSCGASLSTTTYRLLSAWSSSLHFRIEEGHITRAPFSPTWPLEIVNTVTLSESEGKTTITLRGGPINATEEERATFWNAQESVQHGLAGTFDQLAAYLAEGAREI